MKSTSIGKIADVQTGPFGSQLHKEDYVTNGTPIVTVEHLGQKTFTTQNLPCVSAKDKVRLAKYTMRPGDIIFSRVGSVDRCSFATENNDGWLFSGRCLRLRVTDINVNSEYLYYYFCQETVKELIRNHAVGATMPSLNTKLLSELPFTYPEMKQQTRIVSLLSNIDAKIEHNTSINQNLEAQAQAIFKSWFVETANPHWHIGTIADLGEVVGGSTPSKAHSEYYTEHGIAWITPKDLSMDKSKFISHGEIDITQAGLKNSSAKVMPKGTVLFSSRAPIGYIAIAAGEVCTNQGFKSVVPHVHIATPYVYFFLKENLPSIEGVATGSTFKEVSGSAMKSVPAIIPDSDTLSRFTELCVPLFEAQEKLEAESRRLAIIRDTLLPKLMSGEIDVSEVEV
ncbi:MAG: restriction endonuclease subunit S [Victivallales bacterium]|nr:restriction endonuclease subunit S [Victivallales bacterium]